MVFQLTATGAKHLPSGTHFILDESPIALRYQAWLAAGNTPIPMDPEPVPPDLSDIDNLPKLIKAAVLAAAAMSGRTPAQAKAAFLAAWNSLP